MLRPCSLLTSLLAGLLLSLLAGCGGDEFQSEFSPIELESETPPRVPDDTIFRRYIPGKGSPLWHPMAEKSRFTEVPQTPRTGPNQKVPLKPAFLVQGKGLKTLSIRDKFDPIQFNRIEVEATVFGSDSAEEDKDFGSFSEWISVDLMRQGEVLCTSPQLRLDSANQAPTSLIFEFPSMATWRTHFDEIRVRMPGPSFLTTVSMVTLLRADQRSSLPPLDPMDGVRYATLDGETRRGWIMAREEGLRGLIEERAWNFQMQCGPLAAFHVPGQRARMRLHARSKSSEYDSQEWELKTFEAQTPHWETLVAQTREWARSPVELEMELFTEGSDAAFLMVTEPALYPQESSAPVILLVTTEGMGLPFVSEPDPTELPTAIRPWLNSGFSLPQVLPESDGRTPQLVALMTGISPRDSGIWGEDHKLSLQAQTIAEHFHRAGYRTLASVCSAQLSHDASGLAQGFDRYTAPESGLKSASETIRTLGTWLDETPGCPSFLWLHLPGSSDTDSGNPPWGTELEALLQSPALQGATLAFTSTIGQEGVKRSAPLGSQRVPFVLRHPGLDLDWPEDPRIASLQLGQTLLGMAGIEALTFPGTSLLQEPVKARDSGAHFMVGSEAQSLAMQAGNWLFTVNTKSRSGQIRHTQGLYHFGEDPTCVANRAKLPVDLSQARRMRLSLSEWVQDFDNLAWTDQKKVLGTARAWAVPQAFQNATLPQTSWLPVRCDCEQCPQRAGD